MPLLSVSCRVLAVTALALQVLLMAYYTSDLVSSLAAGPPPPSVTSLRDVYDDSSLKIGYTAGTALHLHISVGEITN